MKSNTYNVDLKKDHYSVLQELTKYFLAALTLLRRLMALTGVSGAATGTKILPVQYL